jgi:hypothetical protein
MEAMSRSVALVLVGALAWAATIPVAPGGSRNTIRHLGGPYAAPSTAVP